MLFRKSFFFFFFTETCNKPLHYILWCIDNHKSMSSVLTFLPWSRSHAGWWRWLWLACHSGKHDTSEFWCFYPLPHMRNPYERGDNRVNKDIQSREKKKHLKMQGRGR